MGVGSVSWLQVNWMELFSEGKGVSVSGGCMFSEGLVRREVGIKVGGLLTPGEGDSSARGISRLQRWR